VGAASVVVLLPSEVPAIARYVAEAGGGDLEPLPLAGGRSEPSSLQRRMPVAYDDLDFGT
jgi:hypothetical protein